MTVRRCVCSIAVCSALVVFAAGCHKKVAAAPPAPPPAPTPTAPVTPPPPPPPPAPTPAPAPRPLSEDDVFARKTVDQLNAERPLDDVYFDLDKSEIRDDARRSLQKNADWMKRWTSTSITLEGHCDSRLAVSATSGARVAVEQFDASATRPLMGFGDGWHEQEFNSRTGVRWRWLSERGELKLGGKPWAPSANGRMRLEITSR